jgi:DNA-binding response OmpR family regulator
MAEPERAFTRLELLEATQGGGYEGYERTIDMHIKNLRQKLRAIDPEDNTIQTVFGVGYRAVRKA